MDERTTSEEELRAAAVKRLKEKREFAQHLFVYVLVNAFLIGIWWFTTDGDGFFWPIFPILGWLIGIAMHAWEVFSRPFREDKVRREMDRMR